MKTKIWLLAVLILTTVLASCSLNFDSSQPASATFLSAESLTPVKLDPIAEAIKNLKPRDGDCGLLLAFDTDLSSDRQSYMQFYDSNKELVEKNATNKTIYLTRQGNEIKLASSVDFVASPQRNGFIYLGMARYYEPKPRDKNESLDSREKKSKTGFKNFGFDYTRIWKTDAKSKIPQVRKSVIKKTKKEIDDEYKKIKVEDREYHRNITDYRKISFISDGFYTTNGFYSLIHGGAAWFEGREKAEVVSLTKDTMSPKLNDHFSKSEIHRGFRKERKEWGEYWENEKPEYFENSTFNFARHNGQTHILGLVTVDGNAHRSFYLNADFGRAPKEFIGYQNPHIDFDKFKEIYPTAIDVFVSPNQNTVFVLTKSEIIGIDVKTKREVYRESHKLKFNKVIMVEWATSGFVKKWERELNSN